MGLTWWLNTAWMWKCRREARRFAAATRDVRRVQGEILREIVGRNRATRFGRNCGFEHVRDMRDFQRQLPLSTYDDYAEPLRRIAAGEPNVLTGERVELLEPTSGTTSGQKLIPYTGALQREFQRAVSAWIADLFEHRPAVRQGRAYWSISPALGRQATTAGGIRVGFNDDAAYLGGFERRALRQLLVAPPAVARIADIEAFRYCTLWSLLCAGDLALVSVWNPTFLSTLIRAIEPWKERLIGDLRRGIPNFPDALPPELARQITNWNRPPPERTRFVANVLEQSSSLPDKLRQIWPRLALISCWADAAAAHVVPEVRQLFPEVEIQPKGLLATEGCISIPLCGRPAPVLAVRSHFFEFQLAGAAPGANSRSDDCLLADELEAGGRYRVVVTTGGGFYRYQMHDEVEVVDFENECPLLRFLGKSERVCDLVGEKLGEPHVRSVLDRLFAEARLVPRFALVVPVTTRRPFRYRLYLEVSELQKATMAPEQLATALEKGFAENPHYRYAIGLGQLVPAEVELLDGRSATAWQIYERRCLARGQKLGDIKPAVLDSWTGWPDEFERCRYPDYSCTH
jgi:hypothetical protein